MKGKWTEEMRRKLEGHRKAPPEGLWEGISEQMGFEPEKAIHPASTKRWYWAAAAAVLLAVGFFTFYPHESEKPSSLATTLQPSKDTLQAEPAKVMAEAETPMAEKPLTEKKTPLAKKWANTAETQATPPKKMSGYQEPDAEEPKAPTPPSPTDQNLTTDVEPMEQKEEKSEETTLSLLADNQQKEAENNGEQGDEKNHEQGDGKDHASTVSTPPSPSMASMEPLRRRTSSTGKWTMGLQASGGLLASNNHNGSKDNRGYLMAANYYYSGKTLIEATADYGYATNAEPEETHSKHHLPVRFGMGLQYQLNDRLALLSGINYTWLYSEFTKGNSTTDQRLHYLGVPVGVSYRLWSNQRLQCYLSGSVMLEKCLNEKPWQWSVDAGAGAEYAITRQVGLYLEPSLGYHFDDGTSFEHYYKDHPLAPSIMFGLRMHINE